MKNFVLLLALILCQVSFSQTKKKVVPPPIKMSVPKPPKIKPFYPPPPTVINNVVSILRKNNAPLSFKFEVNKDTIFQPNDEFAEIIDLSASEYSEEINVTISSRRTVDTVKVKYDDGKKTEQIVYAYNDHRKWCDASMNKEIMTAIDKKTNEKLNFKVVLNKTKKNILYLENGKTKRKYLPVEYEGPSPSIGF